MSDKRFFVETVAVREKVVTDKDKFYSYEDLDEIVDMLNDQQATIQSLKEDNEQLRQILKDIVGATDETYTKNKNIYKVTVVFDDEMYDHIRRCLN